MDLEELGLEDTKTAGQHATIILQLKNALGGHGHFEDLIDLEQFLEKRVNMKEGLDYTLYCKRSNRPAETHEDREFKKLIDFYVYKKLDIDTEISKVNDELDELEAYAINTDGEEPTEEKKELIEKKKKLKQKKKQMTPIMTLQTKKSDLAKERLEIIEKYENALSIIKEIQFIEELGMDKDVALKLDIGMRKRLEEMFPEIQKFYLMVFKPDSSIQRKAFVYPKKDNEKQYMETLKNFLNQHNMKFNNALNSKIKISFRGKYVVKINKQLYQNFRSTIATILSTHKVKSKAHETNLKTELHLQGNETRPRAVIEAYEEIIELLRADEFFFEETAEGHGTKDSYQYFALFHTEGDNKLQMLNNHNTGQILIETNFRHKKVTIRGNQKEKEKVKAEIRNL